MDAEQWRAYVLDLRKLMAAQGPLTIDDMLRLAPGEPTPDEIQRAAIESGIDIIRITKDQRRPLR